MGSRPFDPEQYAARSAGPDGVPLERFEVAYATEAPWDIGRPQPAVIDAVEAGHIAGTVLDVGCGTGINAIELARRGLEVHAFDPIPAAVARAREHAAAAGVELEPFVHDALHLDELGRTYDTVLDSGVFHVFSDADRPRYAAGVRSVLQPGGCLVLICFSEREQRPGGPRRVSEPELRATFADGFEVVELARTRYVTTNRPDGGHAWLLVARCMDPVASG